MYLYDLLHYMTPCPMDMWLVRPNEWMLKYCLSFDFVKFVLRDPSLGETINFFLKWFCCYLGVCLLQPGYILSANRSYLHPWHYQFVGPLQEFVEFSHQLLILDLFPYPFLHRVAVTFVSINNIFSHVHVVVSFSTNANINTIITISGSLYM